jgi:hypothetical protein
LAAYKVVSGIICRCPGYARQRGKLKKIACDTWALTRLFLLWVFLAVSGGMGGSIIASQNCEEPEVPTLTESEKN